MSPVPQGEKTGAAGQEHRQDGEQVLGPESSLSIKRMKEMGLNW